MKISKKFKFNYTIVLCVFIIIGIIFYSFYDYIKMYYGYDYDKTLEIYEKSVEQCNGDYINNKEFCDNLIYPLSPKEKFKLLDAKTLFFGIIYGKFSSYMCFILPLIVMIIFLSIVHKDFACGMLRNYLTRETFKKYKMVIDKKILKISLIAPLSVFLIYIICCILTRFNFSVDSSFLNSAEYIEWNYNNIHLYLLINYVTFIFVCIFYCNIAFSFINKNKNILVITIISYISFIIICVMVNLLSIFTNGNSFVFLSRYLNILDYWCVYNLGDCWYGFIVSSFILAIVSFFAREMMLKNKERVIVENEKGII